MRSYVLSALSYPIQLVVGLLAYRKVSQTFYGQGTGRFSGQEISSFRQQIWENINGLLVASRMKKTRTDDDDSDAIFWVLGGNRPSEADTALFGFISSLLISTAYVTIIPQLDYVVYDYADNSARAPESKKVVKSFPTVVDYARRIHNRYFVDYTCWE